MKSFSQKLVVTRQFVRATSWSLYRRIRTFDCNFDNTAITRHVGLTKSPRAQIYEAARGASAVGLSVRVMSARAEMEFPVYYIK